MLNVTPGIVADLAPSGALRAALNLNNPVLAQGTPAAPSGVTVDIGREIAARLGVPPALAKSLLAHIDGTPPPVTEVNGTVVNGSRP